MRRLKIVGLMVLIPAVALPLRAQDPCAPFSGSGGTGINQIQLYSVGYGVSPDTTAISGAASMWNACAGAPNFSTSSGDFAITINFYQGRNNGTQVPNCGTACGCATSSAVHIFEQNANGTRDCTQTWDSLIAHELGHVLGFDNAQAGCSGCRIMGNTACGPTVQSQECDIADLWWYVPNEDGYDGPYDHPCQNPPK
jgi:hypothetical protein